MQKGRLVTAMFLVVLIGAFFSLNKYTYIQKQGDVEVIMPYRAELHGTYLCLPRSDESSSGPGECAQGLKTSAGEYYALDFNLMSQSPPQLTEGENFSASGLVTPIEMLSADHWRKYSVVGIFSITDSVETKEP